MPRFFINVTTSKESFFDDQGSDHASLAAAASAARRDLYELSSKAMGPDVNERLTAIIRDGRHVVAVETLCVSYATVLYKPQR